MHSSSKWFSTQTGSALHVALPTLQPRSEEHTSELQPRQYLVRRLLLEKKTQSSERFPVTQLTRAGFPRAARAPANLCSHYLPLASRSLDRSHAMLRSHV